LNKEVWAIIGARSGSKGVKNKNIKMLGDHPLLAWSIMACKKSKYIKKIIVSTDSNHYASIAKRYGAEVPYIRSKKNSNDTSSDCDWILELINKMRKLEKMPKFFAHIRPTTPLRDPKVIDEVILRIKKTKNFSSIRSVEKMSETSYKSFEIDKNSLLMPLKGLNVKLSQMNNARQTFPETYLANGYIDILKFDNLVNNVSMHGNKIMPYITPQVKEIDTIEDFKYIQYLVKNYKKYQNTLFS